MKCQYAQKNRYSDFIMVKTKKRIEEHIADCSCCQEKYAQNDAIEAFFQERTGLFSIKPNRSALVHAIIQYRKNREHRWWYSIPNILPLEPGYRRAFLFGTACAIILMGYIISSIPNEVAPSMEFIQTSGEQIEELDFYLQEHVLTQDTDLFGDCTISKTLASLDN